MSNIISGASRYLSITSRVTVLLSRSIHEKSVGACCKFGPGFIIKITRYLINAILGINPEIICINQPLVVSSAVHIGVN